MDAWLHLSLGRLVWDMKGFPGNELFTYPSADMPFSYSSWLFGVVYYLAYLLAGAYGMILLKASTVTLAFHVLLRDSLRPYKNLAASLLFLSLAVMVSSHRFVVRPDTFLMVFISFSIFSLNAYLYDVKKGYLYSLPFVHMLWANSHSSITLMFIPFAAFIADGIVQRYMGKDSLVHAPSTSKLKTVAAVFILSFLASLISPYFLDQYTFGSGILAEKWNVQSIGELLPPTGKEKALLYSIIALAGASFAVNRKRISLFHLLLLVPIAYMPFMAIRFKFLLAITAAPIIARNFAGFIEAAGWGEAFRRISVSVLSACFVAIALSVTMINPDALGIREGKFGFGLDDSNMPRGAVKYMDRKGISGRVFNSFRFGQYVIWTGYPERTVYVDGRGYLPGDLLQKLNDARTSNALVDELYHEYGFESILITYPYTQLLVGSGSHASGEYGMLYAPFEHPDWALVHWDDVSMLFLRRSGPYAGTVNADEYRLVAPDKDPAKLITLLSSDMNRDEIIRELERNIAETGSSHAYAFLGILYNASGLHDKAIEALSRVRPGIRKDDFDLEYVSYAAMGDSYQKLGKPDLALQYYAKSFRIRREERILYNMGTIYLSKNDYENAARHLTEAVALNNDAAYIYPPLIEAYQKLGRTAEAEEARRKYAALNPSLGAAEEYFKKGIEAYSKRDYETAIDELNRSLASSPSNPLVHTTIGYVYYDSGQLDKASQHFGQAISLDPSHANAHYGLGLTYKKLGDKDKAVEHFRKYVELNPGGPFSAKAKNAIAGLTNRSN